MHLVATGTGPTEAHQASFAAGHRKFFQRATRRGMGGHAAEAGRAFAKHGGRLVRLIVVFHNGNPDEGNGVGTRPQPKGSRR